MIQTEISALGANPTLSSIAIYLRAKFVAQDRSVWLRYVSPLDVVGAAKRRGVQITEGRIPYNRIPDLYFGLLEMDVTHRTLDPEVPVE